MSQQDEKRARIIAEQAAREAERALNSPPKAPAKRRSNWAASPPVAPVRRFNRKIPQGGTP